MTRLDQYAPQGGEVVKQGHRERRAKDPKTSSDKQQYKLPQGKCGATSMPANATKTDKKSENITQTGRSHIV